MMEIAVATSQWRAGHQPGGRSGPSHCQECYQRWPCDWAVLCEEVEEREAHIAALEALARHLLTTTQAGWKAYHDGVCGPTCHGQTYDCLVSPPAVLRDPLAVQLMAEEGS